MKTQTELLDYVDSLSYSDISGNGTRTGMALKIADEKFPLTSPENYRSDAGDVVLIITDGEPIRRPGEDTFGSKYKSNSNGERMLAKDRAQNLRGRDIVVFGLRIRTEDTLSKFRSDIKEWSTKGKYFEANKDSLQRILDELTNVSCIDP
ncbi:Hypothetical predicted protein, partial [Paramuricea clavata]